MTKQNAFTNILLVYPKAPDDSYWSFSHCMGMIGKKAATPPLGLITVASMLPAEEYSLRLIDMNASALSDVDIGWADVVFVSAMIAQKDSFEEVLNRVKAQGGTTVVGGPYPSSAYAETKNADCFVIGEAEGTWDVFLPDLRKGTLKPAYAAPVRDSEAEALRAHFGDAAHIAQAASYPDVSLTPLPRFDLLDIDKYACMSVQASRGCPVGCDFCDIWRRFGRKSRVKPTQRILEEMDALYKLGWRDSVFLVDDNFIGNRARAKEILARLIGWQERNGWPFAFVTEATLSLADDEELLDLMAKAGFVSVFVGIETPSEDSLRETGKHINLTGSMADKVARIQSKGIQLMSGFIIGFDADPEDIADRMSACIQEMGIPQAMIGLLNALPDTNLYDRLSAEKRIRFQTTGNNTHSFAMNFQPARPEERVLHDYKQVLQAAYPPNMESYFRRCEVLRDRWPARNGRRLGDLQLGWKLKVLGRYLATVAASRYRFAALRFLTKTLLTKPSFIEQAIELSVKGHHHWAITRQAFEIDSMRSRMMESLRATAVSIQSKLDAFEKTLEGIVPSQVLQGDNIIRELVAFLDRANITDTSIEVMNLYRKAEVVLGEIDLQGRRVQRQVKREFRRLSRSTRRALRSEMDTFLSELERLCTNLYTDGVAASPLRIR